MLVLHIMVDVFVQQAVDPPLYMNKKEDLTKPQDF